MKIGYLILISLSKTDAVDKCACSTTTFKKPAAFGYNVNGYIDQNYLIIECAPDAGGRHVFHTYSIVDGPVKDGSPAVRKINTFSLDAKEMMYEPVCFKNGLLVAATLNGTF